MAWDRIRRILGPGLYWTKSREEFMLAIRIARARDDDYVVGHLEILLKRRDRVCADVPKRD
jgi:hypothetical protein